MLPHHIEYIESLGFEATQAILIPDTLLFANSDNSKIIAVKGGYIEYFRKNTNESKISSVLDLSLISSLYLDDELNDLQLITACYTLGITNIHRFKQDFNEAHKIIVEFDRTNTALQSIAETMKANRLISRNNVVSVDDIQFKQEFGMSVVVLAEQYNQQQDVKVN